MTIDVIPGTILTNRYNYNNSSIHNSSISKNKCKKLTSLKLGVRTTWWSQTSKTAKIFWRTLDGAVQGGPYKVTLVDSH